MGLTDEQLRRLPGYVLTYIDRLERERDSLRAELEQRAGADTNVWQQASVVFGVPDLPLLKNAEIRFDMVDDKDHDGAFRRQRYIDVRHAYRDPSTLQIRGATGIIIEPQAANTVAIRVRER